jgi:hypothetical protein
MPATLIAHEKRVQRSPMVGYPAACNAAAIGRTMDRFPPI